MGRAHHILCTLRYWHDFPRAFADNEHRGRSGFRLVGVAAATAGATASFCLSRFCFGDTLEDWLTERPTFNAAKKAVDEEGWRIQLLLRLSPVVPFGLLNYLLGLTNT